MKYDIAIIGAGSAGLSVAAAAAQFGEKVILFEKGDMGGDCLNSGCVPSKALLAAAKAAQAHRTSAGFGVAADEPRITFGKVMDHVANVIAGIAPHDSQARFEALGVSVVRAPARFTGPTTIAAADKTYEARRIVIATGSRPSAPPIPGLAETPFFTNETIFRNRKLPRHLIIIGGGPIGLEMALAHHRLGAEVTVLEAFQPLAKDDPELAAIVIDSLKAEGIDIRAGAKIKAVSGNTSGIQIVLDGADRVQGSHLLVAAGRKPNIEGLNLEAAGIATTPRGISVDDGLRTTNPKVYAAGDVAGGLQFTHVAGFHAGLIIRNALFRLPVKNSSGVIPWVTYTDPELAHVGLTEAEARKVHGDGLRVLRSSFAENDRARAEGKTKGLVKIMADPKGRILGASIVGPNAGDLIAMWALAVNRKLRLSAIAGMVLPYPTLAETGKRAAVSHYAGLAERPMLRKLIGFLKVLG